MAQQLAQQQGQLAQAGFMLPTANVQQLQQLMAAQALQEQLAVAQVQAHVQAQMQAQNTAAILNALQRNPGLSLISPGQLATLNALQASGGVPAQPGLALNPLMAASLAGSSGLNVGVPDKLGTVITPQGEFPKFRE